MGGTLFLDVSGLTPLSELHSEVADGLSRLADDREIDSSAGSFGSVASAVSHALDGASRSRSGTIEITRRSGDTIADLLARAHQLYLRGDGEDADALRAAAEVLAAADGTSVDAGAPAVPTVGTTGAVAPAPGVAGGSGADPSSQIGQQVGQIAAGIAQSVQGLAQGLIQLPQQVLPGMTRSAGPGVGTDGADQATDEDVDERADRDREEADERAEERRRERNTAPVPADGAQPGRTADVGSPPVPPPTAERPPPAPIRPPRPTP